MKKAFILFVLSTFFMACGNNPRMPGNSTGFKTPKGITTTIKLPEATQVAMDAALDKLFYDVSGRGYTKKLKHSEYVIEVRLDCIDRNGTKVWLERLDDYDGTEYDQDPRPGYGAVYQAERVEFPANSFKICMDSASTMATTTRNGAEHTILYYNDYSEFTRTKVHINSGHPIIPMK